MSSNVQIYQIEKNAESVRKTILTNAIKMLTERQLLKPEDLEKNIEKILAVKSDDMIYSIDLDPVNEEKAKEYTDKFIIKLLLQKITSVNKTSIVADFLNTYNKNSKLIVVKDISKKANQLIKTNYPKTEIFLDVDLLMNIVDHHLVPKHDVLPESEASTFYEKFNCKKRNMPKLLTSDPIAKYYNMKLGDICRITRPSENSGYCTTYRLVIKG